MSRGSAEDVLVASLKRYEFQDASQRCITLESANVVYMSLTRTDRERKSTEGHVNMAEIRNGCLLLNTAEYCQVTASEVTSRI